MGVGGCDFFEKNITAMSKFTQQINVAYPAGNKPIFEEWFAENYKGCNTDRELIPVFFTSYWVNNNYGNDLAARKELQSYVDSLDRSKKWFCICQYDDGVMVDWKGLDVLEFNMSKQVGVQLPLLCQPHPYKFGTPKRYLASFFGSKTHPVRGKLESFKDIKGYYISFEPHDIADYCRVLHESIFVLCPRGYGFSSFRTTEALQYGAIPIYISDSFIVPFDLNFNYYGLMIHSDTVDHLPEVLDNIPDMEIITKQDRCKQIYNDYYTFEGCFKNIIASLEIEYSSRKTG
jgi:hypothetical protein